MNTGMENPIKDNRIVCDSTFAIRFLSFVKDVKANDACSYDEKESMISYAKRLLKYQCLTATDKSEINYLRTMNVYEENIKPYLVTHDGVELFEGKQTIVYSCMRVPNHTDQVLHFKLSGESDIKRRSQNRLFFANKDKCEEYIDFNAPKISKADLDKAGLLDKFKIKTIGGHA